MYRTKKDVDKHVENLISKLTVKEFKTRAYSVARLYYEVGDYASCQKYVEQYLTQKDNNAAAHKLLAQALQKVGQKEKALEQFKISLDIDPTQTSTILEICELLADDEVTIDPGRAKYWCEKAESTFPRHPVTFRLRERLVTVSNPDPEALIKLLTTELAVRPKDATLHCRLLKHYLHTNQIKQAFEHSSSIEFGKKTNHFSKVYAWYDTLLEILKHNSLKTNDWLYQLLLLTVRERLCVLSLTESPSGSAKSLIEANELLHAYDQAIEKVANAGAPTGFGEFHFGLLQHHRGQFVFHAATYLLKKAKKDQLSWREATSAASPLMLIAWQTVPLDSKVNWLGHAPEEQQIAVNRWYVEGTYRCSQSGHYLLANIQDRSQSFLDRISQSCSGHFKDKLYEKIFTGKDHLTKIKTSHFVSDAYEKPVLRLPRRIEVEAYDVDAQRENPMSLHHFVWTLLNYKNFAHFKCTLFDMLTPTANSCGPETINKLDVHAFLYCAALSARQQKSSEITLLSPDKPVVIPANITDLLCPLSQMKWWDCAYKFSQNELGTELTDIRATLSRGIEVVRCVDNHGLDPELLCILGSIFSEKAKLTTTVAEKSNLESRAGLYYSAALPMLEKLKNKMIIKMPDKRLFEYTHKELSLKELNSLIEESKLYVAVNHINEGDYEKVIEILSTVKSAHAYYHLGQTYRKIAMEERNMSRDNNSVETRSKFANIMMKAKSYAYKALNRVKETEMSKDHPLYSDIQALIEEVETNMNKIDPDFSVNNDGDGKYSSDENVSSGGSEHIQTRNNNFQIFTNISSTPKQASNSNLTHYRTAMDSHILEQPRVDTHFLEKIENQIKNFQTRLADEFMEQSKTWFEENRRLGNQIMSTIQSDIQNTTDQFKVLKISVDNIKDQITECRNECKDVGDLRKQIAELQKEVSKLKKASSEQNIDDSDLYNDDEYRSGESASNFAAQLPFQPPVMPPFNQRLVPPFPVPTNPYQLYNQSLYNLYNQYSQFGQNAGAPPLFDPTRTPVNYPGVYPSPEQMYLDVAAHLVPPVVPPPVPVVPPVPPVSTVPSAASVPPAVAPVTTSKATSTVEPKSTPKPLPANVVITSSDPLPTCTTAPAPILSVTIPSKHIKNATPHNYQIPLPPGNETKVTSPPVFSFPSADNKPVSTPSTLINWGQPSIFKTTHGSTSVNTFTGSKNDSLDKSVVDGSFTASPNASFNKSRTLSERSNTSVENYDPCPDFKPIIPLPAEVKVTTGEENENVIFSARAKLFRFVDKQWKERGIGEMKLLRHKVTGKVRVLMRREQIHKICANHVITPEMEIKPMQKESKAYFWVANDFADESVVLEKFCIRFKTAEIAQQFSEIFEKSRIESKNIQKTPTKAEPVKVYGIQVQKPAQTSAPIKPVFGFSSVTTPQNKIEFGGFTFNSTPISKTVQDTIIKSESKVAEPNVSKVNVFSSLNFGKSTSTSSPFSNIFSTSNSNTASPITSSVASSPATKQETPTKINTSDVVEEFEPNVEFKPVVPLPALVDQKTGEEDETILFEYRSKLLRFDANSKEWKERGLGNIKILVHKNDPQKVRLLMRREQIMKVCCNHAVTKDMTFQKMPNVDKAVTWCAKDFSDGELVAETFCLRFKTAQICDEFIDALKKAQSNMKHDSKASKEEQNTAKQNTFGFGDQFKPKSGSWYCESCYTNNLESFMKCACCEQPKPQSKTTVSAPSAPTAVITAAAGWGDKFKPKAGSWECGACLIRNEEIVDYCTACNGPKDPNMLKKESNASISTPTESTFKFKFGVPSQAVTTTPAGSAAPPKPQTANSTPVATSGFGDKFKPKEGSWECKECFVRNDSSVDICCACNSSRNPGATTEKSTSMFGSALTPSGPKFSFGIPPSANNSEQKLMPKTEPSSIFDGTGGHKFKFGVPGATQEQSSIIFGAGVPTNDIPINLSANSKSENKPIKAALLPTPQTDSTAFGIKEAGNFDFKFKPKTPPKGKSPMKSAKSPGEESDDNEYASEDEGHHIHFNPVIPMPDKVEVVTGEENEVELYGHRAKLYRFTGGEWKERGIGIVKILKHKNSGKLRVVMRREQVLKICLNHALTPEVSYSSKDDKTWLFAANDFSEGELSLQQFCLRFKTKEIAAEFKQTVDNTRGGKFTDKSDTDSVKDSDSDDVKFVSEIQATEDEKKRAKELMLPENFYTYTAKEPCRGCRGCTEDDDKSIQSSSTTSFASFKTDSAGTSAYTTPLKTIAMSSAAFQSPMTSFYGTPASLDKTSDITIFRTPLGSTGSNTNTASPATPTNTIATDDKENTALKPNASTANQTSTSVKSSILAMPKLTTSSDKNEATKSLFDTQPKITDAKSIFSQAKPIDDTKSVFSASNAGISSNKSIFSFTPDTAKDQSQESEVKSLFGGDAKPEVKSIFGGDAKPVNLFSGGSGLFGPGAVSDQQKPSTGIFGSGASIFGSKISQPQEFGSSKSTIGNSGASSQVSPWSLGAAAAESKKPDVTPTAVKEPEKKTEETIETPFKVDNSLSFAALSSSGPGFGVQKNTDFRWEGAGQQLFSAAQKASSDADKSVNDSGAADEPSGGAEEEYDPHYEPIVPLPDKIVVTTGEEDEEKMFGERCKLYRYDEKTREWKERGVGEMKILYHPERKTYRFLLRREQVHKAVLNMLLFADLELLPMKNSDRAWTWAGRNFAENTAGEQETLAVRFKSTDLAVAFKDRVTECVRKMQAAAVPTVSSANSYKLLRLPKALRDGARVDSEILARSKDQVDGRLIGQAIKLQATPAQTSIVEETIKPVEPLRRPKEVEAAFMSAQAEASNQDGKHNGQAKLVVPVEPPKQVQFVEPTQEYPEEEDYEHDYEDEYDYYNEEEDNEATYYSCNGMALVRQGETETICENANIHVLFDQEIYSPKILVTDNDTGEILADMLIHTETEFILHKTKCSWSGTDYTSHNPVDKTVTIDFRNKETALFFYNSCETSKGATYSSTDPDADPEA